MLGVEGGVGRCDGIKQMLKAKLRDGVRGPAPLPPPSPAVALVE